MNCFPRLTRWWLGCLHLTRRSSLRAIGGAAIWLSIGVAMGAQTPSSPSAPPPDLPANPAAVGPAIRPELPTLWVVGDSTAAKSSGNPHQGWGVPLADYFDPARMNVANRARGGRSSRTYVTEGLWASVASQLKSGDVVLLQFGHNDGGAINEEPPGSTRPLRARGSLPGLGEETQDIVNALTGKPETVRTFGSYLRQMVAETKARGARPVVMSLTVRNLWKDGKVERASGHYRAWIRALAGHESVPWIDHSRLIADAYQELGEAATKAFFPTDYAHTSPAGADLNASLVVAGLKGLRPALLGDWLSAKGAAVEADRIGWLNLPEPERLQLPSLVLLGDSTVRNGRGDGSRGEWGWGEPLADWVDPEKLNLVNRAIGGLSSRTFRTQGHLARALTLVKPGDCVVLQFGHNDSGAVNDRERARGTLKGTGEETESIENLLTGRHETVHTYGWYLRQAVREIRAAGATPVLCSPVPRKTWKDGRIARASESHGGWARRVAEEEKVLFVDLNELIATRYEALGEQAVNALFADAHTHTSRSGAELNASIVAEALRSAGVVVGLRPSPATRGQP